MPHKRETQMVCNLHFPTGDYLFQNFLEFGIEGHFRRENLTSFLVGWKTLLTIAPAGARTHDLPHTQTSYKQEVPHPTRSATHSLLASISFLDAVLSPTYSVCITSLGGDTLLDQAQCGNIQTHTQHMDQIPSLTHIMAGWRRSLEHTDTHNIWIKPACTLISGTLSLTDIHRPAR